MQWLWLLTLIPMFFVWASVHELLHVWAAHKTVGVSSWSIKVYPHRLDGRFVWASTTYVVDAEPSPRDRWKISLAPRLANLASGVLLQGAVVLEGWAFILWSVVWGSNLVDLAWGSIGYSEESDLRRAARSLERNPWALRIGGMTTMLFFVALWAAGLVFGEKYG